MEGYLRGIERTTSSLIVDRAIAGLGSPGLINGALTIIAAILPPHRQPIVMDWDRSVSRVAYCRRRLHTVCLVAMVYV